MVLVTWHVQLDEQSNPPDVEEAGANEDEDTGTQVAPIFRLEEVAVNTAEEDEDAVLDIGCSSHVVANLAVTPALGFLCFVALRGVSGIEVHGSSSDLQEPLLVEEEAACLKVTLYSSAGLVSLVTLSWLDPLLSAGSKRPLELKDILLLAPRDRAKASYKLAETVTTRDECSGTLGNEMSCVWHARNFADGELKDELFCIRFSSIETGDLCAVIEVIPDPILKRDDTNILYTCKISYVDAILGTTLKVPTVDGTVDLKVPAGTQPSTTLVMAKKGVPVLNKSNKAMQSQQYLEAIELYSFAIALLDKNAVFYCNRAAAYTQISMCSEAIKAYSRLGLAYYAQGEYADAIEKGFKKALELDPHNESVKENIRVAEQKLREEEQRQRRNQNTNMGHNQDPGMGGQGIPSHFSMPLNPDMMSMFMNMTGNRGGDGNINGTNEHEIRVGGNINIDLGAADQMPEEFSGALRSMMQMFGGSQEGNNNNPQGTNGRPSGN
ncbi:unnamed protein product [Eruca vesicaria subsp. sativa]|uniref:Chaperone DnaJ C-terminal domain-containing protein n=1 Tax=Eruca vesicaria subsp. sativa TaxID=29727 RepID=A0ABC8JQE7_ERUVS|nr:unnamed protein product [Eruca vesicaria subsp. sativa]